MSTFPHELQDILPQVPPAAEVADVFNRRILAVEFHQEVAYRQAFEAYCQWYYDAAARHRQELQEMRHDINILGWFHQ